MITNALIPIRFMTISRFEVGRGRLFRGQMRAICLIRTLYAGCDSEGENSASG